MDPAPASPVDSNLSARASNSASRRFRATLAAQVSALESALAAACEQETAQAAREAAEAATAFVQHRPTAEDSQSREKAPSKERDGGVRNLVEELSLWPELQRLREENEELRRAIQENDQSGSRESPISGPDKGGDCAFTFKPQVRVTEPAASSDVSPRVVGITGAVAQDAAADIVSPRPRAVTAGSLSAGISRGNASASQSASAVGVSAASRQRLGCHRTNPTNKQATPSRIPKPRHHVAVSSTLEDLEDHRLLKLSAGAVTKRSPSPRFTRPQEQPRHPTPTSTRRPASTGRTAKDDSSIGAGGAKVLKTRGMFDKRTLRRRNKDAFSDAIKAWQAAHDAPGCSSASTSTGCQVFVRVRPIFEKERHQGEFESVTAFEPWGEVVVHNCLFQADLVRMFIHHYGFRFPRTFGPDAGNDAVFEEVGSPLVAHALGGQLSTLFMFGQTGSGKTFTMDSTIELASKRFATVLSADGAGGNDDSPSVLKVRAFEIVGKKCIDLLSRNGPELRLLDGEDGRTNVVGATEVNAKSEAELLATLRDAFAARSTASHGRNEESSRSHCVCIIELPVTGGSLVLVDCAGTERRQDTDQHSAERTKETAEINTSLHALKECIRYRSRQLRQGAMANKGDDCCKDGASVRVPYRGSQLTRVLHESFTRPGSRLFVIGTVAPASLDTEHTLSTLRTLQLLQGASAGNQDSTSFEEKVDVEVMSARHCFLKQASRVPAKGPVRQTSKDSKDLPIASPATAPASDMIAIDVEAERLARIGPTVEADSHEAVASKADEGYPADAEDMYSDDGFEPDDEQN